MNWTYPKGQCSDWAARTKPWVTRYGNLGDAHSWATAWAAHGGAVYSAPLPGDVVCFQPGGLYAAPYGHVAVVESVSGPTFVVSEQNYSAGPGRTDRRTVQLGSGMAFLRETATGTGGSDDMNDDQAKALAVVVDLAVIGRVLGDEGIITMANGLLGANPLGAVYALQKQDESLSWQRDLWDMVRNWQPKMAQLAADVAALKASPPSGSTAALAVLVDAAVTARLAPVVTAVEKILASMEATT